MMSVFCILVTDQVPSFMEHYKLPQFAVHALYSQLLVIEYTSKAYNIILHAHTHTDNKKGLFESYINASIYISGLNSFVLFK